MTSSVNQGRVVTDNQAQAKFDLAGYLAERQTQVEKALDLPQPTALHKRLKILIAPPFYADE